MTPRASVYVSRRVPAPVRSELEASFDVSLHDFETPPSRGELLAAAHGRDGIVTMLSDRVDAELLDEAGPQLRVVANYAVGYDNVDVDECSRRGVVASNTPGVLTEATAELTMALLLSLVRRVTEGDRLLRRREPWIWAPTHLLGTGLRGRTLGVVGLGRIGSEVGRLAEAFGMHVVYTDEAPRAGVSWEYLSFDELIARAHVVTLHCPLTPETRHLIDRDVLSAMRRDAFLVNSSRGPVIDEEALAGALITGELAGAALDVYEREPEIAERLLECENAVLAPHLGSATHEAREAMGMLCVSALRAVLLEGRAPENALNASVLAETTP